MSREPSTSNMEPSPQWSYPQVMDGSPLPQLPKETVSSHVPAWTEILFHGLLPGGPPPGLHPPGGPPLDFNSNSSFHRLKITFYWVLFS